MIGCGFFCTQMGCRFAAMRAFGNRRSLLAIAPFEHWGESPRYGQAAVRAQRSHMGSPRKRCVVTAGPTVICQVVSGMK